MLAEANLEETTTNRKIVTFEDVRITIEGIHPDQAIIFRRLEGKFQ